MVVKGQVIKTKNLSITMNLNYNLPNIEMNESYLIQVICLELRGPGSLSIGAGSAGPMVGTSKDQQQVCLG